MRTWGSCKYREECIIEECPGTRHCSNYDKFYVLHNYPMRWANGSLWSHKKAGDYVIDDDVDTKYIASLLLDTNYICPICRKGMSKNQASSGPCSPSLDDINNSHHLYRGNLRVICMECNLMKGARSDKQWHDDMLLRVKRLEELGV